MKITPKRLTALGLLLLLPSVGCSVRAERDRSEEDSVFTIDEPVEPIVLNGNVKVLTPQESLLLTTGPNLVMNPKAEDLSLSEMPRMMALQQTDNAAFIVGQTGNQEGFLSRVLAPKDVNGEQVAELEPARIDEMVAHGDWKYHVAAADEAEIEAAPFSDEEELASAPAERLPDDMNLMLQAEKTKKFIFKINLAGKKLSGPAGPANAAVTIQEGTLSFSPEVTIGGKHRNKKISQFAFLTTGTVRLQMKIAASLSKGKSNGVKPTFIPALKKPFAFMLGGVPVAGTINFDVGGGLSVSSDLKGTLTTRIDCSFPIKVGAKLANGKWQRTWAPNMSCTSEKVTLSSEGSTGVKVSLAPELSVRLYGVVGPAVDLAPYLAATTTFKPSPRSCSHQLKAGMSSTLSVSAKLFKWTAVPYSTSLFDKSKVLRSASGCR